MLAILCTFALSSLLSVGLSVWSTARSKNKAAVVEVAGRQRTLAERYVLQVLLVRDGEQADPGAIGWDLRKSGEALLDGARRPPSQVTTTTSPCRGKGIASPAASSSRRGGWRTT